MNWRQFLQCQFGRRDAMSDRVREAKPCPTERSDKKSRSLMGRTTQNPIRPRSVLSWCGIDSTAIDQTLSGLLLNRICAPETRTVSPPVAKMPALDATRGLYNNGLPIKNTLCQTPICHRSSGQSLICSEATTSNRTMAR